MRVSTSRRRLLCSIGLGSASALLAACSQQPPPAPTAVPPKPTTAPPVPVEAPKPTASAVAVASPVPAAASNLETQLYEAAKKEGKVAWWDQLEPNVVQQFIESFKKRYPGIEVEYFEGTVDVIKTRAFAEARAGNVSFDINKSGSGSGFWPEYKQMNLVSDLTELFVTAGVPKDSLNEGSYNPEWTVYGVSFNPNLVKEAELPRTWEGFLDPKWKGKLAVENRLALFLQTTPHWGGEEKVVAYLKRLREQAPRFTNGSTATDTLLVAGEFPIAVGTYMQNALKFKGQPWGWVRLDEVYIAAPGPGYTIPPQAPHPNAARLFLLWFFGPEGKQIYERLRFDSNPLPGSGTGPSKFLEERKMTVKVTPRSFSEDKHYIRSYLEAIGLPVT
jgi:iron(III) transport system substrate-binding protein